MLTVFPRATSATCKSSSHFIILNSEIFLMIAAVINLLVLALMLQYEFRLKSFTWQGYKTITLMCLVLFEVLMLINFAFAKTSHSFRVMLQTVEEGTRGVIFFLVAMYFLKKSSKILKNKQRWAKATNWFLLVVLCIFVGIEIVCGVTIYKFDRTDYNACKGLTDLLM